MKEQVGEGAVLRRPLSHFYVIQAPRKGWWQ